MTALAGTIPDDATSRGRAGVNPATPIARGDRPNSGARSLDERAHSIASVEPGVRAVAGVLTRLRELPM